LFALVKRRLQPVDGPIEAFQGGVELIHGKTTGAETNQRASGNHCRDARIS
jgi:hypothetical protein